MEKIKIIVVGLGKQANEDHLPEIAQNSNYELVGIVDKDQDVVRRQAHLYSVKGYHDLKEAIVNCQFDVAFLALPHNEYISHIEILAKNGVHIIKEKPFAMNFEEALKIRSFAKKNKVKVLVTLQRRFNPIFQKAKEYIDSIGKIYLVEGKYFLNINKLDEGWRAQKSLSGGGALLDMGYHFVDLLIWYMGMPASVFAQLSNGNRINQKYDVEDTASISFNFPNDYYHQKCLGHILVSRVGSEKNEHIEFLGTEGKVQVFKKEILLFNKENELISREHFTGGNQAVLSKMMNEFAKIIKDEKNFDEDEHMNHAAFIEAAYLSDSVSASVDIKKFIDSKMHNIA